MMIKTIKVDHVFKQVDHKFCEKKNCIPAGFGG